MVHPLMRYLESALLAGAGVPHGFSIRAGGVSRPPFDALNLGGAVGDDPEAVAENLRRLCADAGFQRIHQASQVHGRRVVDVESGTDPEALLRKEADALVTSTPGLAVGVRTADCMPILLADPEAHAVAAVHAGWRGTLARIAEAAVERLVERHGARRERLIAALGPSIRACCYEVSGDLAIRFADGFGPSVVQAAVGEGGPHLDLAVANLAILESAGVARTRVDVLDACNACAPERFFSYRWDGARSGRHLSFVAPAGSRSRRFP